MLCRWTVLSPRRCWSSLPAAAIRAAEVPCTKSESRLPLRAATRARAEHLLLDFNLNLGGQFTSLRFGLEAKEGYSRGILVHLRFKYYNASNLGIKREEINILIVLKYIT